VRHHSTSSEQRISILPENPLVNLVKHFKNKLPQNGVIHLRQTLVSKTEEF